MDIGYIRIRQSLAKLKPLRCPVVVGKVFPRQTTTKLRAKCCQTPA